jgi:hypothetical protein
VTALPAGWMYVADFGMRQMAAPNMIAANVALGQDGLKAEDALAEYIKAQARMIEGHLTEAKIAGPQPIAFAGADEASLLFVRHRRGEGVDMLHAQTYVRVGLWLGIVTLTTPEPQLRVVRPDYEAFMNGLRILPPQEK